MYHLILLSCAKSAMSEVQYKQCSHPEKDIEGNSIYYHCDEQLVCCSTLERPGDCCVPGMDKKVPLKMLLVYLLVSVLALLFLILTVYGIYKAVRRKKQLAYRARRFDNYGDEILDPPPYDHKPPPPDYQAHINPSAPPGDTL